MCSQSSKQASSQVQSRDAEFENPPTVTPPPALLCLASQKSGAWNQGPGAAWMGPVKLWKGKWETTSPSSASVRSPLSRQWDSERTDFKTKAAYSSNIM